MSQDKNLSKTTATEQASTRPSIAPLVDIYENADQYLVLADVPGVSNDDVQIRFEDGELSIRATRSPASQGQYVGNELLEADFSRRFTIPETVDAEKIDAKLQNGVLHLVLPKATRAKPRQISVRAG